MAKNLTEPPAVVRDDQKQPVKPHRLRRTMAFSLEILVAVVVALVITALLRVFVFQVFQVPSGSMESTLEQGDRIIAYRLGEFARGDVVVFEDPDARWMGPQPMSTNPLRRGLEMIHLLPDSSQGYLVKRVIGMPGDHVTCCNAQGAIEINGVALDETSYLYTDPAGLQVAPSDSSFDVIVPRGHLFVLGDHRDRSGDSRLHMCEAAPGLPEGTYGFIPLENVVGPVAVTLLPVGRYTTFHTPDAFSAIPEPTQEPPSAPVLGEGTCT